MSDLPAPLTPADCDLRGFDWMPLWGNRLFSSSWYRAARKDGRGGIASLKLWWVAMTQHPAGSLPNDEEELCMIADFGEDMRAWNKHRAVAMHGFILCSDNRWYHPFVSEQAVEAYDRKLKASQTRKMDAERLRRWRAAQNDSNPPPKPNGETPHETRFNNGFTPPETRFETRPETRAVLSRDSRQDKTRQDKPPRSPPVHGGARRRGQKSSRNGFHEADRVPEPLTIDGNIEDFEPWLRRISNG